MSIAVNQVVSAGNSAGSSTLTVSISNTQAGALLHVLVTQFTYDYTTISSITDSQGNTYTAIAAQIEGSGGINGRHYYAQNIVGGAGANTITVTFSGSSRWRQVAVKEIRGVATSSALVGNAQQEQIAPGTGTDAITSGTAAISAQPNLLSGWALQQFGAYAVSAGTGFTDDGGEEPAASGGGSWRGASKRTTSTSSQAATFTVATSGANFSTFVAVFKEEAVSAVTVTDVDTDESISATQTNVVVTGSNFGASQGAGSVTIRQGAVAVAQSIDSWAATSIQFDTVFDSGATDLKYGTAALRVTDNAAAYGELSITITPPTGSVYVDLATPNTTSAYRITAAPDLASGDQLEARGLSGYAFPSGHTINADATVTLDAGTVATAFEVRAWSAADATWGAWATQYIDPNPITVTPPRGTLTLTGYAPSVSLGAAQRIEVPSGTLSLVAYAPGVSVTSTTGTVVPELIGLPRTDAANAIIAAGLVEAASFWYDAAPVTTVIAQTPAAGTVVTAGSTVEIRVSAGADATTPGRVGRTTFRFRQPRTWFRFRNPS